MVFRLTYELVRSFFSGDMNEEGSEYSLSVSNRRLSTNAHVFKEPHYGRREITTGLFDAVQPMIRVVSSGEMLDYGHSRENYLNAIGRAGRGKELSVFSTEIVTLFVDFGDRRQWPTRGPKPPCGVSTSRNRLPIRKPV